MVESEAEGRMTGVKPVSVIDIGSNSVRLVIYEGLTRAPTQFFNEKILCGLGKNLATTGELNPEGVEMAIKTLHRFRAVSEQAGASAIFALATAAAREASNGPEFATKVEEILGCRLNVLSGEEEAYYAGLGIIAGINTPDGIVGDFGGASLELIDVMGNKTHGGITLPLGGLRVMEVSNEDIDAAKDYAAQHIDTAYILEAGKGRDFYAVGGTWRSIGKLHMEATNYPLQMMQGYQIEYDEMITFLDKIIAEDEIKRDTMKAVSKNRRGLLPYGAVVMRQVLQKMQPTKICFSSLGVREGFLHSLLPAQEAARDPLIAACEELSTLRARSPEHSRELVNWTASAFPVFDAHETVNEARYRHAACLLTDISWRAHPDYRGSQAVNIIAHGAFVGISQSGRAYIALTSYHRYEGLFDNNASKGLTEIATPRLLYFSKLLGGLLRVLYLFSASMPGIIPRLKFQASNLEGEDAPQIHFIVPKDLQHFISDRVITRLNHLERFTGKKIGLKIE